MSTVSRCERVMADTMEPLYDGGFRLNSIEKYAYRCEGCGLVWDRKWHAETCESRNHVARWTQKYYSGPIVNGVPTYVREYPRTALRRDPVQRR